VPTCVVRIQVAEMTSNNKISKETVPIRSHNKTV